MSTFKFWQKNVFLSDMNKNLAPDTGLNSNTINHRDFLTVCTIPVNFLFSSFFGNEIDKKRGEGEGDKMFQSPKYAFKLK